MHLRSEQDQHENDGRWDYWPVSIGEPNDVADIRLVAIEVGPHVGEAKIHDALKGTKFANVPVRSA